jgi:hypothetical protein
MSLNQSSKLIEEYLHYINDLLSDIQDVDILRESLDDLVYVCKEKWSRYILPENVSLVPENHYVTLSQVRQFSSTEQSVKKN